MNPDPVGADPVRAPNMSNVPSVRDVPEAPLTTPTTVPKALSPDADVRRHSLADPDPWEEQPAGLADGESAFKPLTREQAQDLRARQPALSPWSLVGWQAMAGVVMVAGWGLWTLQGDKTWSALFGAVSVVVPNALMAWGMTRRSAMAGSASMLSFMVWELIKIILAVAILVAVVLRYPALSWPALLSALVVCLKANWLVLLRQGRIRK
ncbi:ATP synthase subunit I [Roseateles amylovorans]|uniref:ATP synthase subunit I n=1 Tax=Roseateles amylovorans TaxID=2978473 RepID=A0ABY6B1V8_9BURK|nr:ATP synthase subunit I [Roseateles amylovorans]UXH78810.1 ATP synthase subunit I [Roseateles amylovorans]